MDLIQPAESPASLKGTPSPREYPLIGPQDEAPFRIFNPAGRARVLVVADHASAAIPAAMNRLGLADWALNRHISWDVGADLLAMALAKRLDAPAVLAGFSRLLIDPNRQLSDASVIPAVSDGIAIPANLNLSETAREDRIQSFYQPYHQAIDQQLARLTERCPAPAMIAVHTCAPVFQRRTRPWQIGVMWDKDPRIAVPWMDQLGQDSDLCVGDNLPYSGRHPHDYTVDHHAEARSLPHVGMEVRHDLVMDQAGADHWAGIIAGSLHDILANPALYTLLESPND